MSGEFDEESLTVTYSDCTRKDVVFNEDGSILTSYGNDGTILINAVTNTLMGAGTIVYQADPNADDPPVSRRAR